MQNIAQQIHFLNPEGRYQLNIILHSIVCDCYFSSRHRNVVSMASLSINTESLRAQLYSYLKVKTNKTSAKKICYLSKQEPVSSQPSRSRILCRRVLKNILKSSQTGRSWRKCKTCVKIYKNEESNVQDNCLDYSLGCT